MLRKGRTREQASAQFAGEWDEGGTGNAFSTANRRFAPLKMPFLPYSGGPTQSGGLKGRGQCEALHSPETPGTLSAWPVRKSGGPTQSGGLKGQGQCEALHSPETPGTLSAWPVRRRMSPKMIKDERAAALSNSPWDFFDSLKARRTRLFLRSIEKKDAPARADFIPPPCSPSLCGACPRKTRPSAPGRSENRLSGRCRCSAFP